MRLKISHRTEYNYDAPLSYALQRIRLTPQGFARVTQVAEAVLNDSLAGGMCLPEGGMGIVVGDIEYCVSNDGACEPGCQTDFHIDDITFTPGAGTLRVRTQFDVQVDVPVQFDPIIGPSRSCAKTVNLKK